MSVDATQRAWRSGAKGNHLLVLLALADHAGGLDDPFGEAYPAVPRLARMTGVHDRTVQRCLRELEAQGFIRRTGKKAHAPGKVTVVYRLEAPQVGGDDSPPVARDTTTGDTHVTQTAPNRPRAAAAPERVRVPDEAPLTVAQRKAVAALRRVADEKCAALDEVKALEAAAKRPDAAVDAEAENFAEWWLLGNGQRKRMRVVTSAWRNWIKGAAPAGGSGGLARVASTQHTGDLSRFGTEW